jgi:hypothetical protein
MKFTMAPPHALTTRSIRRARKSFFGCCLRLKSSYLGPVLVSDNVSTSERAVAPERLLRSFLKKQKTAPCARGFLPLHRRNFLRNRGGQLPTQGGQFLTRGSPVRVQGGPHRKKGGPVRTSGGPLGTRGNSFRPTSYPRRATLGEKRITAGPPGICAWGALETRFPGAGTRFLATENLANGPKCPLFIQFRVPPPQKPRK